MRNLKRALSLALASVMLMGMMVVGSSAVSYPDVDDADHVDAIEVLSAVGVIVGDNGNFRPDDSVSRNEMAVIMAKLILGTYEADSYVGNHPFTDVPSWADRYVAACYNSGIIAGRTETTYDGNATVTAVEAAAMMLRALGYEDLSKGAAQWDQPVAAKANQINLFEGMSGASNAAMNRNSVAQLALNTLQATMVTTEKEGDIEIPGTIVIPGKITYTEVQSNAVWARAINRVDGKDENNTVELGEKLYKGDLKRNTADTDAFGRPATKWTYKSDEVVTVADGADASYTVEVKSETIYKDLGLSAAKTASKIVDGVDSGTFKVEKNNTSNKLGGNGVLVEAYKGDDGSITITVINPYIGEVAKVTEAKGNDERTVTVDGLKFETESFEEDDVVVYTQADGVIKSMYLAEIVSDVEVTRVKGESEMVAGGETYKFVKSEDFAFNSNDIKVENTLDVYLDSYGYVVKVKVSEGTTDYAYVLDIGIDSSRFGSGTPYAKLLLTDASVVEAKLDKGDYTETKNLTDAGQVKTQLENKFEDFIVEYSKNSKDVYYLEAKGSEAESNKNIDVDSGKAKMTLNGSVVYADSKTIFLVDDGDDNYTVYTGYNAVPDMEATGNATVAWYCKTGSVADVVYVKGVDTGADHILFLLGGECGKKITSKDGDPYYECPAVLDGEIVTVKLDKSAKESGTKLYSRVYYSNADEEIIDFTKTSDKAFTTDTNKSEYSFTGVIAKKLSNGNITLKDAVGGVNTFAVAEDVNVFEYSDKITSSRIGGVEEGSSILAIVKDGKISTIFYTEAEEDDNKPTEIPNLEIISRNWNATGTNKTTNAITIDEIKVKAGETVTLEDVEKAVVAKVLDIHEDWTYDAASCGEDESGNYIVAFKNANGAPRYAKFDVSLVSGAKKVENVTDPSKLAEALEDNDVVILDTNATLNSGVGADKVVTVSEGKELTLGAGAVSGLVNGEGDIKVTGAITSGGNITTSGTITIGANGSFDVLGQGGGAGGDDSLLREADVVLDGTTLGSAGSVYGTVTVKGNATLNAKLTTNRLVIGEGSKVSLSDWANLEVQVITVKAGASIVKGSGWNAVAVCDLEIAMSKSDAPDIGYVKGTINGEEVYATFEAGNLKSALQKALADNLITND